jgi:hypothetical protein
MMDPLIELLVKGGIGIVVGYIIAKWLAAAVLKLWEKFEERTRQQEERCAADNRLLTSRITELENRHHGLFSEYLKAANEALNKHAESDTILARALDRLTQIETGEFRAVERKDRK